MGESFRFTSEALEWWNKLITSVDRVRRVHLWEAVSHPPSQELTGLEQHPTSTLVLCLAGAARLEDHRERLDLGADEAVVIAAGAWHRHAALRSGSLIYRQGVIAQRSDFFLESHAQRIVAVLPEQPARRLLEAVSAETDGKPRLKQLRRLLAHLHNETVQPLSAEHPACLPMEYALWQNLHRSDAVPRILRASGLSRAQAYRVFSQRWGCGISEIVRRERLELARTLLVGGISVVEVAGRCGISNRSVFSRSFRRRWGVPPSRLPAAP